MNTAAKLIISLIIPSVAAAIGGLATSRGLQEWYPALTKPSFNPPDWIFGPVWTVLYLLMGVALFLVWNNKTADRTLVVTALAAFAAQIILNVLWSVLFFLLQSPIAGLICIVLLLAAIAVTIIAFYRVSPLASFLLLPYFLWVSFATILNFEIFRLN